MSCTGKEKFCPLCGKPLVNGQCKDCGYYEDTVVMENEKRSYYTNESSNNPTQNTYQQQQKAYETKNKLSQSSSILFCVFLTFSFPLIGIIFSCSTLKNGTKLSKIVAACCIFLSAIFFIIRILTFLVPEINLNF